MSATWHYGLVARWWAEFNVGGPEIDYFRGLIAQHGQPALDAGCGTGRLLLPLLRDGLDVDGVDISGDMLAYCQEHAARAGLTPALLEQPLHLLDLPRRYRTIFACGSFGIGGDRALDVAAAERLRRHLEPGGVLAIDRPGAREASRWREWAERGQSGLPRPWPAEGDRRAAADGTVLEMRSRIAAVDAMASVVTMQLRVGIRRDAVLVDEEEYTLRHSIYSEEQLIVLLRGVGFADVRGVNGYRAAGAGADDPPVRVVLANR